MITEYNPDKKYYTMVAKRRSTDNARLAIKVSCIKLDGIWYLVDTTGNPVKPLLIVSDAGKESPYTDDDIWEIGT